MRLLLAELNVQYLFRKKFEITAHMKPAALAMYLLIRTFSFKKYVTEKSTSNPVHPTKPNFIIRERSGIRILVIFIRTN